MNCENIQNLRYKLQKRLRRLSSTGYQTFHFALRHFWLFLEGNEILKGIMDELVLRHPKAADDAKRMCDVRKGWVGDTEAEHSAVCCYVLKYCASNDNDHIEIELGDVYGGSSDPGFETSLSKFRENFLEPLYDYLDEQLDDQKLILSLLRRYKHKCEWFARDALFSRFKGEQGKGERILVQHLYEYLHDQGIDFHIEPHSASGEADFIEQQTTDNDRLVADAKIFDPGRGKGKSYIASAFGQIYRYTRDYNEPFGYLIIYQTSERDLAFTLSGTTRLTPHVTYNGKTIFLLTVDIFPHAEPASKRGPLKPDAITECDLIRATEAPNPTTDP